MAPSTSGREEGAEKRGPRPHRCNDRVEDLLQAAFTFEFAAKIRPAYRSLAKCLRSEPGEEPADRYVVITDPSLYTNAGAVRRERKPER